MGIGASSDSTKNHLLRISKMSDSGSESNLKNAEEMSKEKKDGCHELNAGRVDSNRHISMDFRPFVIKYVNYIPEIRGCREGYVKLWWFPSDFCQSRLGDRQIGSYTNNLICHIQEME